MPHEKQGGPATLRLGLAALVLALGPALSERAAAAAGDGPGGFKKGMVFGLFATSEPEHTDRAMAEMKGLGVGSISIVIPWVAKNVRSLDMAPRADMTPSDGSLRYATRRAHAMGMSVMLMPFLYIDEMEDGEWRGTLSPPDWSVWFRNYGEFILRYAGIANEENVELFVIGSELGSTERRRDDWMKLIARVREAYDGRITYSVNWDHRDAISFADGLDVLGMNGYFELSEGGQPSVADLVRSWKPIQARIESWRRRWDKKILITEVGYPSRPDASVDPWNYERPGGPDPEGQRRCYQAFVEAWGSDPGLEGVYFYLWWGEGGLEDAGYTPRAKPAAEVIREWYSE